MASAEREPNEGLGAVPPAGSVGKAPGQGGASLKLNTFFVFSYPEKAQSCYDYELFYGQRVYMRNVAAEF